MSSPIGSPPHLSTQTLPDSLQSPPGTRPNCLTTTTEAGRKRKQLAADPTLRGEGTLPATPLPQTCPVTSRHCGLSDHFKLKTLILIQKNPGSGGMANINKCLMISLCFLFPVITEIIGLRWGGGCRWDKINDLNCLDFPRLVVHQFPRWGEIMTNKSNQEQRRDSQRRSTSPPC